MEKILILVPHEDDEILMTAGIIARTVEQKKSVTVAIATNGDYEGNSKEEGCVRLKESMAGLKYLGVSEQDIVFLGYADTGMEQKESFLYRLYQEKDENKCHAGHCSNETYGWEEKPDYHMTCFGKPAEYCRKNFKEDVRRLIISGGYTAVFTTAKEDLHGDHSGLFEFVKEILSEEKKKSMQKSGKTVLPNLYVGVVHSVAGDENWPCREPGGVFTKPEGFENGSLKWEERISFPVPEAMKNRDLQKNPKAIALSKHKSALKDDAVEFLYSFLKDEELFWKITY